MFSATASTVSFFAKEEKLRTRFQKICQDIRQESVVSETLWNVFVHEFEILEKYKYRFPDTVAECTVDMAETFKLNFLKCFTAKDCENYEKTLYQITPHLAQLLSTDTSVLQYRSELLSIWSEIVLQISNNLKKSTFLDQTENVIIVIFQCIFYTGNYYTQLKALELVLKYIKSVDRSIQIEVLNEIMESNELREMLLEFRLNCFDEDSRIFLNTFNMNISDEVPVYSINALSGEIGTLVVRKPMITEHFEQPLWIDFNSSTHTISFFCDRKTFFPEQNSGKTKTWIMVEISVDTLTLKDEQSLIHIKTAEKIRLVPSSFENDIRFNLEEINDIYLHFTSTNLILIKDAKIIDFMNSKKNMSTDRQTEIICFNTFHQFKCKKKLQTRKLRNSGEIISVNDKAVECHKLTKTSKKLENNSTDEVVFKTTDNDDFSNLKSSIVIPETTISHIFKQTADIVVPDKNKPPPSDENQNISQLNQRKHMSRRESFETTFPKKCVVQLPVMKSPEKYKENITKNANKIPQVKNVKTKPLQVDSSDIDKNVDDESIKVYDVNSRRYTLRSKPRNNKKLNKEIETCNENISKKNVKSRRNIKNNVPAINKENDNDLEKTKTKLQQNKKNVNKKNFENSTIEMVGNESISNFNKHKKLMQTQEINTKLENKNIDNKVNVENKVNIKENRKRKITSVDNQILEHSVEIHQSPKSKIGYIQSNISRGPPANEFAINSSLRLVNMVRPLGTARNNSQQENNDTITSIIPANPLNTDTEQINETIAEYANHNDNIDITNKLQKRKRIMCTPEELDTVFDNLNETDTSIQRTTKKFFKTSEPEGNVYDLETILKDAPQPALKKQREKSLKRGTSIETKRNMSKVLSNNNKNVTDDIKVDCKQLILMQSMIKTNNNNGNNIQQIENSQIYDIPVEENANIKTKSNVGKEFPLESVINNKDSGQLFVEKTIDHEYIIISDDEKPEDNIALSKLKKQQCKKNKLNNISDSSTKAKRQIRNTKTDNKLSIRNNNENTIISNMQRDNQMVNTEEQPTNDKNNISFSQKIRNFEGLIEQNKKSRKETKKSNITIYNNQQDLSSETDSKKLVINTSVSTPNNLHSPINSNYNKIDDLLTEDEDEHEENNNNLAIKETKEYIDNEITITPNERCDKTWLYEKFLNDIDSKNSSNKVFKNINSTDSVNMSIEPIRHEEPKPPELNFNYLKYTNSIEEYPNDSVSAIIVERPDETNVNDDRDLKTPIRLGQNRICLRQSQEKQNQSSIYSSSDGPSQHDSSWRAKTSTKCSSILPQTNQNVEIIETHTKTIRIEGNNRTEERRISLKRRINNNEQEDEQDFEPYNKFKHELHYITNNIAEKYKNISKYPNEMSLQNDIAIFSKMYEQSNKSYMESYERMVNLRKKLKLEENVCINSLTNGIDIMETLSNKLQNKKEYLENNIERSKTQFKQIFHNFKDSIYKLRNKIWSNYMDGFVQGFVENMKKFYKLDEEE